MDDSRTPTPPLLPKFTPVPRKHLVSHGWTPEKQRGFIEALAMTGSVRMAAEAVGMSHCGVYKLRTAPGAGSFVRAWDEAVSLGAACIRDVPFDRAIHGVPETVVVGKNTLIERRKFNHRTMIWALQHHMPEQYPGGSTLKRPRGEAEVLSAATIAEARETIMQRIEAIKARRVRIGANDAGGADTEGG